MRLTTYMATRREEYNAPDQTEDTPLKDGSVTERPG